MARILSIATVCFTIWIISSSRRIYFQVRQIESGRIRGFVHEILSGKYVECYLGIPYAAPPVGNLRYENPVEPEPWNYIRNTTELPPACLQAQSWDYIHTHRPNFLREDENCLYLNVYVPQTADVTNASYPVYIYIHGGSNEQGMAAMLDGDVLAAYTSMIVVAPNYRLAALGFLSMGDKSFPGNYGLMDQLAAIKWVHRNIKYFGGDQSKVTLAGHSAGGKDTGLHLSSPLAKGLFRYAILQSGSPLAYWSILYPPNKPALYATEFAAKLNCTKISSEAIKNCLKDLPAVKLINGTIERPPRNSRYFTVIDGKYIPTKPHDLIKTGELNADIVMVGVTKDEGADSINFLGPDFSRQNFRFLLDTNKPGFPKVPFITDLLLYEYTNWKNPDDYIELLKGFAELYGDYSLISPAVLVADWISDRGIPVFMYSFNHRSVNYPMPDWMGVPHGQDIFYLFGAPLVGHELYNYTENDREMSRKLMTLWGNFVKHGKPMIESRAFERYTVKDRRAYFKMHSDNGFAEVTQEYQLKARKMAFWNVLLPAMEQKAWELPVPPQEPAAHFETLAWVFISLTCILFTLCIILVICFFQKHPSRTVHLA